MLLPLLSLVVVSVVRFGQLYSIPVSEIGLDAFPFTVDDVVRNDQVLKVMDQIYVMLEVTFYDHLKKLFSLIDGLVLNVAG